MCVRWCGNVCAIMCIHIFDYVRIRARWIGPYAWRNVRNQFRGCMWVFHGLFVGILWNVRNVIGNPSAAFWQSVRSRRGRFIVPAYTYTPTKWQTEMCVWWCGNVYLMMWKCIFGYGNTRFCLCQDTGTMNRPLRLTECSPRISWVYVGISRIVCWYFVECSQCYWQSVSNILAICSQP